MVDRTATDVLAAEREGGGGRRTPVLSVAFRANDPQDASSRHELDGIDVVEFGRGDRAAVRDQHHGLRRLTLRIQDPHMSRDHGRLLRAEEGWLLEDPASKNGAVVGERPTRHAAVHLGEIFELGHTLFLQDTADDALPADHLASSDELATLHPGLARDAALLRRIAPTLVPVLLLGETGTGKEVWARAAHQGSRRRGAFVAVNCGGLAPGLVDAQLFGHRRGAFSGAVADRPGFVVAADQGTLFLDEVGELPPPAQTALLRALQEHEVIPVGDVAPIRVDLRVVAATNRDLGALVASGRFRDDLYARLLGISVHLPPLRARRCDIGLLTGRLLARAGAAVRFSPRAAHDLLHHRWPLNVRELERCLAAAVALAGGAMVERSHLPEEVRGGRAALPPPTAPLDDELGDPRRAELVELLRRHRGNVAAVARAVGKGRQQIHRWAARYGIDLGSFRQSK
jgi:transcriptional regulator with PAS, ATPase and Fis domain